MPDQLPYAGVEVVDALGGLIGGYCTKMLRDGGASVTLLESGDGDELRTWRVRAAGDAEPDGEGGALFAHLRAGQRAVRVDEDEARTRWASASDCVVVGATGLDVDALLATNPGLVVVSVTPYGRGVDPDRPATDFTLQADAGGLAVRGRPGAEPYHAAGRTGDWFAAAVAATAALAAMRRARDTGVGGLIDLSRAECTTLAMTNYSSLLAEMRGPRGMKGPPAITETPAIEPTSDGFVAFTTNTFEQFSAFCLMIGQPELAERFASAASRQRAWTEWNEIVHDWTTARTTAEIVEQAVALRIPVAPVCNGSSAPQVDHFVERGVFQPAADGSSIAPRRPWSSPGVPYPPPAPPPPRPVTEGEPPSPRDRAPVSPEPDLPLAGVRVLDNTAWWAGPMATWVLATLGAEVVHVESTSRPDGMRMVGGAFHDQPRWWDRSWFFLSVNTNKKSVTLDLGSDTGRDIYRRLVADFDVVVENYTPRVFEQFGFTWDQLSEINDQLVFARMPAFGLDGPWRDRSGFAQTMESLSGLAWVTGHVDDQPRLQGGPCDPNAGVHAAFAIVAALEHRDSTGRGALVEIPMVESALNVAAEQVIEHSAYGNLIDRNGNRGPYASPQGLFSCRSGTLALAVTDDATWGSVARLIHGLADLDRHRDADEIDEVIATWGSERDAAVAAEELRSVGVPAAVVRDPRRTPDHPDYRSRGFYERIDHDVVGAHTVPGLPFRLTGVDRWVRRAAPTLGEHNAEILARIGIGEAELAALSEAGVTGTSIAI